MLAPSHCIRAFVCDCSMYDIHDPNTTHMTANPQNGNRPHTRYTLLVLDVLQLINIYEVHFLRAS